MEEVSGKGTLFLFTSQFPYGNSENFLETEIIYLSHYFEKVIVVPQFNAGEIRSLPGNVVVEKIAPEQISLFSMQLLKMIAGEIISGGNRIYFLNRLRYFISYTRSILAYTYQVEKIISKYNGGVFYSYWFDVPALALSLLGIKGIVPQYYSRAHGYDVYEGRREGGFIPYRKLMVNSPVKLFVVSDNGKNYLVNKYPALKDKTRMQRLGTIDHGTGPVEMDFHIVTCSSLIPLKQLEKLAQALTLLDRKIKWTHLGDGPMRENIEKIMRGQPHEFDLRGHLSQEEIFSFYKKKHVSLFLNLSSTEGFPVSIMEALSFGIPVYASSVGGIPEVINDSNGGRIDSDITPKQLADLIKSWHNLFYSSHSNYLLLRKNARLTWESNFNAEKNYSYFCELLKR